MMVTKSQNPKIVLVFGCENTAHYKKLKLNTFMTLSLIDIQTNSVLVARFPG